MMTKSTTTTTMMMSVKNEKVLKRPLGQNEVFANSAHSKRNLNTMIGLTLLTRQGVDEGLLKCALQEFQHSYPQLTSRIINGFFTPMECPLLPLDTSFLIQDMLHEEFNVEKGPLWRVQLINESNMDSAELGFGPELEALLKDDSPSRVRWRYFLRYILGKVNQSNIENFDENEEGFRSFILMTFHPSISDTTGALILMKEFLVILDVILEGKSFEAHKSSDSSLHSSIESLLESSVLGFQFRNIFPSLSQMMMNMMNTSSKLRRNSPLENKINGQGVSGHVDKTHILRGWLSENETVEILAMCEEDDVSLHGLCLASGLLALYRILDSKDPVTFRVRNNISLRAYCESGPKHGCLSSYFEEDYAVEAISERYQFWRFAHELTVRLNSAKGEKLPLKNLKMNSKNPCFSLEGSKLFCDLTVECFGDLGHLFRRTNTTTYADNWNKPLNITKRNIRLEDVFHVVSAQNMGSPFTHSSHLLHGRLNIFLEYYSTYTDQRHAFMLRDEIVNILRMAGDKEQ